MPPSGGIVVSGARFSTGGVDASGISLWTSPPACFGNRHLAHDGEFLPIDYARIARCPQELWRWLGEACG